MSSPKPLPIPDDPLRAFLRPKPAAAVEKAAPVDPGTPAPTPTPQATATTRPTTPIPVPPLHDQQAGPLGGRSTVTQAGKLRKTVYFTPEQWSRLQRRAREGRQSYSDVIALALEQLLSHPSAHGALDPNGQAR